MCVCVCVVWCQFRLNDRTPQYTLLYYNGTPETIYNVIFFYFFFTLLSRATYFSLLFAHLRRRVRERRPSFFIFRFFVVPTTYYHPGNNRSHRRRRRVYLFSPLLINCRFRPAVTLRCIVFCTVARHAYLLSCIFFTLVFFFFFYLYTSREISNVIQFRTAYITFPKRVLSTFRVPFRKRKRVGWRRSPPQCHYVYVRLRLSTVTVIIIMKIDNVIYIVNNYYFTPPSTKNKYLLNSNND